MIEDVIEAVPEGYLMARPREIPDKVTFDKCGFVLVKDVVVNSVIDTAIHFNTMARTI